MPVAVRYLNGKYRVIGTDGRPETTPNGAARDGGGFDTKAEADRQARAINAQTLGKSLEAALNALR